MSCEPELQKLESKRAILNQQLMNAQTQAEANRIERELWALRALISYRKSRAQADQKIPQAHRPQFPDHA